MHRANFKKAKSCVYPIGRTKLFKNVNFCYSYTNINTVYIPVDTHIEKEVNNV